MLGDGTRPSHGFPLPRGLRDGANEADNVEAGVVIEALVLGGDGGLDKVGRDAVERHVGAIARVGVGQSIKQLAVAVINAGRLECTGPVTQLRRPRQVGGHQTVADGRSRCHQQPAHKQHQ